MIYLDNNATTQVDKEVLKVMLPYLETEYANPSSMYDFAKKPAEALKIAREQVRDFYGAEDTMPAVTDYDLIIIDEAHRGYILDREMSEDELQKRYARKYVKFGNGE